ncbi:MAG: hypothetical protein IPP74_13505 [Alphaproteobacteria bacterium]|nr:hypothetical protein [Alphaproteobacteria bacterium]
MAATVSTWPTLLDVAKRLDPNGQTAAVANVLSQWNEILDDIPFLEGNLPDGHKISIAKSLPAPTWRTANKGISPTKGTTSQLVETVGNLANYSEIDKDNAELNGNTAAWRASEDRLILEGMNQAFAGALIYGDTATDPEKFNGLAPRYYTKTVATSTVANQVIDAGGSGSDNTSIYLVGWSPETVFGIYPKGSKAGLTMEDKGQVTIYDANLGRFEGYRTFYQWKSGLCVKDHRYVVRIANIDVSDLKTAGDSTDTSANILKHMSMALDYLYNISAVKPVFYMHQTVRAMLRVKLTSKSNTWVTLEDWQTPSGIMRPTLMFQGVPVRRVDQILLTESAIS